MCYDREKTGKRGDTVYGLEKGIGLTNNQLKIIAMLSMLIDHVGMLLFPSVRVLRIIGRLAFPIFAFMIAEGCAHTRSRGKYLLKIVAMALLCQIVYAVAEGSVYQCVLVTFTLSILIIFAVDRWMEAKTAASCAAMVAAITLAVFMTLVAPQLLKDTDYGVDYGFWGVLLPVAVYYIPGKHGKLLAVTLILTALGMTVGGRQWYGLLAVPVLALYNGCRGRLKLKYGFYIFYPVHLALLYLISML